MQPFRDNRRVLWLAGGAALLIGILAWGLFGPGTEKLPGSGGPDVSVPGMTNVPGEGAPRLELEHEPAQP